MWSFIPGAVVALIAIIITLVVTIAPVRRKDDILDFVVDPLICTAYALFFVGCFVYLI